MLKGQLNMQAAKKIIVIGVGVAGMTAALRLADQGCDVVLISSAELCRADSSMDREGINFLSEPDRCHDFFKDTVAYGEFLANQHLPWQMCEQAAGLVHLLKRVGVLFDETAEGALRVTKLDGSRTARTIRCQSGVGRQLNSILAAQITRQVQQKKITSFFYCDFL